MLLRGGMLAAALMGLSGCASAPPEPRAAASYRDYLIGRVANLRSDHSVAADRYISALARTPDDPALIEGAVMAALAAGDGARARQVARMSGAGDGAVAYAQLVLAADALAARDWRSAARNLTHVEGDAAEELIARMLAVWAEAGRGRQGAAGADLATLTTIRPYGGLFAYQQAMALDFIGRRDEALAAYDVGAKSGLWLPTAIEYHADLLARQGQGEGARALLSAEANRGNSAIAAALARLETGRSVAAAPLTPARGAAAGLYGLSAIFVQEQDTTNALAVLALALMLDPELEAARLAFAQAHADMGHIDMARAVLARVAPGSPYAISARVMESWMALDAGEEERAISLAQANAEGGDPRAVRALADIYRDRKRYAEAEPLYSRLIAAESGNWRLYFARGAARERLGRWPDAEADMQRALELAPDQPDVMNYLGYSWVDRGERMPEALALIQRAVELRPMSGAIVDSLGWAHYRLGEYAQALDLLERAVELDPADPTLNDHLGDVYWRVGRRIEARYQWQRALTFEPDAPAPIQAKITDGLPQEPPLRTARQ